MHKARTINKWNTAIWTFLFCIFHRNLTGPTPQDNFSWGFREVFVRFSLGFRFKKVFVNQFLRAAGAPARRPGPQRHAKIGTNNDLNQSVRRPSRCTGVPVYRCPGVPAVIKKLSWGVGKNGKQNRNAHISIPLVSTSNILINENNDKWRKQKQWDL